MAIDPTRLPQRRLPALFLLALATFVVAVAATAILVAVRHTHSTPTTGALEGSGVVATATRTVPAFTAVDLTGANGVVVHVGGLQAVAVRGDANLIRYVTTTVRNGTLTIGQSRDFRTTHRLGVEVTVPELEAVTLTGAGAISVDGVAADRFTVRAPGSGVLNVGGRTATLDATLSGTGTVRLSELSTRDATATVSGTGLLVVDASRSLDATVSGVGSILRSRRRRLRWSCPSARGRRAGRPPPFPSGSR